MELVGDEGIRQARHQTELTHTIAFLDENLLSPSTSHTFPSGRRTAEHSAHLELIHTGLSTCLDISCQREVRIEIGICSVTSTRFRSIR